VTLTLAQAITVAILAFSSFFCGWCLYRLRAKAREAALERQLLDTKAAIPQLESAVRNREQRIAALGVEVDDGKRRLADLETQFRAKERDVFARDRALRTLNAELSVVKADLANASPMPETEAVATLRERLALSEARGRELAEQLAPYEVERAEWQAQRTALETEIADRAAEHERQTQELERQRTQAAKWQARVPKLIESARERDARIQALATQVASLTANLDAATLSVARAETDRDGLREELAAAARELDSRNDELVQTGAELLAVRNGIAQAETEFAKKLATSIRLGREEVDRLHGEIDRLTRELGAAISSRNAGVEARVALDTQIAERTETLAQVQTLADRAHAEVQRLGAELASASEHRAGLEAECRALTARAETAEAELAVAIARADGRDAELAVANERATRAQAEAGSSKSDAVAALARVDETQSRVEGLQTELDAALARVNEMRTQLEATEARVNALQSTSSTVTQATDGTDVRLANQIEKNRELTAALEAHERSIAELGRDRALTEKSIAVLQQQLEQERASNERLAAQLRERRTSESPPVTLQATAAAPQRPKNLFTAPPTQRDDLQQIKGIGAAFAHRLNDLGIYQFRQIAGLSEAEIVWLENELRMFRGRIGRDDWLGQALAQLKPPPSDLLLPLPLDRV